MTQTVTRPPFPAAVIAGLVGIVLLGVSVPSAQAAGPWRWPLPGHPVVVRGFDPPLQPWGPGHRGVDLQGRPGAAVTAAGAGVVGFAGLLAGRGVVTVHHPGGLETTYEPVTAVVRPGQRVVAGERLGRLDPGHGDCGPGYACLHWGLRRGATYLDPLSLMGVGRVRLFPIWVDDPPPAPTGRVAGPLAQPDTRPARRPGPAAPGPARPRSHRSPVAGLVTVAGAAGGLAVGATLLPRRRRVGAR